MINVTRKSYQRYSIITGVIATLGAIIAVVGLVWMNGLGAFLIGAVLFLLGGSAAALLSLSPRPYTYTITCGELQAVMKVEERSTRTESWEFRINQLIKDAKTREVVRSEELVRFHVRDPWTQKGKSTIKQSIDSCLGGYPNTKELYEKILEAIHMHVQTT